MFLYRAEKQRMFTLTSILVWTQSRLTAATPANQIPSMAEVH